MRIATGKFNFPTEQSSKWQMCGDERANRLLESKANNSRFTYENVHKNSMETHTHGHVGNETGIGKLDFVRQRCKFAVRSCSLESLAIFCQPWFVLLSRRGPIQFCAAIK